MDEIEEFIGFVKEDLIEMYGVSEVQATSLIDDFGLRQLIEKHGTLAVHYSPNEWAEIIYERKT